MHRGEIGPNDGRVGGGSYSPSTETAIIKTYRNLVAGDETGGRPQFRKRNCIRADSCTKQRVRLYRQRRRALGEGGIG